MENAIMKPFEGDYLQQSASLPVELWREDLKEMIKTLDSSLKTHRDFITASMLSYVSVLLGCKVKLDAAGYTNTAGLAIILIGRSATGKSEPIKRLREPVEAIENRWHKEYLNSYSQWHKGGQQGEKPHEKKLIEDDYTYEKLIEDLQFNGNGLGIIRDEIKGWIDDWSAYHKSGEASKYLTLLDGGRVRLSRKNNDKDIVISHAQISVLGGIQPKYLRKTFTEDMLISGFVPRLLFCFPDFTIKKRCREHMPESILEPWTELCNKLANLEPRTLTLDSDAENLYYDYCDCLDKLSGNDVFNDDMAAMYGKMQINVLRLAIATHFMGNNAELRTISKEEIQYNINLIEYFKRCWLKMYEYIKDDDIKATTEQIIHYLKKHNPTVSQTDIAKAIGCTQPYVCRVLKER